MSTTLTAPHKEPDTSAPTDAVSREFHWTVPPFYRAGDIGAFHELLNVELVHGRLIEHSGQTPRHSYTVTCLAEQMRASLEPRLNVQEHRPLHVAPDTETNTDLLVFTGNKRDYRERHPSPKDVALLVEVADVSTDYDTGEKAHLYAQVGVQEYWVVLPEENHIVVHRAPSPDGYASITTHRVGETIAPLAATDIALLVTDLLGETTQPEYENA